ncbi:MAG: HD domain-containing phosphohydrolase [Solirubrobacterales bacterium]
MSARLLVVHDDAAERSTATGALEGHYEVVCAADATEARGKLISGLIDVMICDIELPGESGMDLIRSLLAKEEHNLAVVVVADHDSPDLAAEVFDVGAYGYLVKPCRGGDLRITVDNALRRRALDKQARTHQRGLERDVMLKGLEAERMRQQLKTSHESLERSRLETVHRLSLAVEVRDQVAGHHLSRMGSYCEDLARRLGLDEEICDHIALAAQMHDIGKIAVPDSILLKDGPLTHEERIQMEMHAEIGRRILQGSESPLLQLAETIAWTHHEKFDGTGYPRGLGGDEIPIEGRIAAVADVFDSLTRARPYRPAVPYKQAMQTMAEGRGTHFDPHVLDAFMGEAPAEASDPTTARFVQQPLRLDGSLAT